jgi:hypothetical protein
MAGGRRLEDEDTSRADQPLVESTLARNEDERPDEVIALAPGPLRRNDDRPSGGPTDA